ncbi:MAG: Na/Pi cotransporter family protein, partial [Sedimenticola sp.]
YDNALALAIGANVGTTITAVLGSLTSNTEGKRLALSDVLFKVSAGIVFILSMDQIMWLVDLISSVIGIAQTDYTLKLAVFHTIFNVAGVIIMVPLVHHLVRLVTKIMPEIKTPGAEPMYLNESAFELPDTAMESVRKETLHLYDNAFAIIAHGLCLHRDDILSEKDLQDVVNQPEKPMSIDMEDEYGINIKRLYSEIISFISKVNTIMSPEQADELFMLRSAGRYIVGAINDTKHMHNNLVQYIASDNPHIRSEYNKLRIGLGSVLRRLEKTRADEQGLDDDVLSMNIIKLEMAEHDRTVNETIEQLIRDGLITAQMATSLMNDSSYAYDVAKDLVQMSEVLFAKGDDGYKAAVRSVLLDEDEASEIIESQNI